MSPFEWVPFQPLVIQRVSLCILCANDLMMKGTEPGCQIITFSFISVCYFFLYFGYFFANDCPRPKRWAEYTSQ